MSSDACSLADLLGRGEATSVELTQSAIATVEAGNGSINAVVAPLFERALDRAAAVDRARQTGSAPSPLAGVPILLKDAGQELAGTPHWVGTPVLHRERHVSPATTALAARLENAGLVVIGKTNLPELSAGGTTEPSEFGPTRNPFDLDRTVGGSSGGSAAAVAAGWVPIAHGGDATGSLRFPASACGLWTLKPSRGRVPSLPAAGMDDGGEVWAEGFLTRTVRDLAAMFSLTASGATAVERPGRLRIGVLVDDVVTGLAPDPDCVAAVDAVAAALEHLGHHVEASHPAPLDGLFARVMGPFVVASQHGRASQVRWIEDRIGRPLREGDLDPVSLELAAQGRALPPERVASASDELMAAMRPIVDWWDDFDVLVTPTMRVPPWPIGTRHEAPLVGGYAMAFSFTGQPAMNVPGHRTAAGLPVGAQIVGRHRADEVLLALAADLA